MISSALYRFFGMVQISSIWLFTTLDLDQEFQTRSMARAGMVLTHLVPSE